MEYTCSNPWPLEQAGHGMALVDHLTISLSTHCESCPQSQGWQCSGTAWPNIWPNDNLTILSFLKQRTFCVTNIITNTGTLISSIFTAVTYRGGLIRSCGVRTGTLWTYINLLDVWEPHWGTPLWWPKKTLYVCLKAYQFHDWLPIWSGLTVSQNHTFSASWSTPNYTLTASGMMYSLSSCISHSQLSLGSFCCLILNTCIALFSSNHELMASVMGCRPETNELPDSPQACLSLWNSVKTRLADFVSPHAYWCVENLCHHKATSTVSGMFHYRESSPSGEVWPNLG